LSEEWGRLTLRNIENVQFTMAVGYKHDPGIEKYRGRILRVSSVICQLCSRRGGIDWLGELKNNSTMWPEHCLTLISNNETHDDDERNNEGLENLT
jgi:hypothetical protein